MKSARRADGSEFLTCVNLGWHRSELPQVEEQRFTRAKKLEEIKAEADGLMKQLAKQNGAAGFLIAEKLR